MHDTSRPTKYWSCGSNVYPLEHQRQYRVALPNPNLHLQTRQEPPPNLRAILDELPHRLGALQRHNEQNKQHEAKAAPHQLQVGGHQTQSNKLQPLTDTVTL